jgi:hypothetical protein
MLPSYIKLVVKQDLFVLENTLFLRVSHGSKPYALLIRISISLSLVDRVLGLLFQLSLVKDFLDNVFIILSDIIVFLKIFSSS